MAVVSIAILLLPGQLPAVTPRLPHQRQHARPLPLRRKNQRAFQHAAV